MPRTLSFPYMLKVPALSWQMDLAENGIRTWIFTLARIPAAGPVQNMEIAGRPFDPQWWSPWLLREQKVIWQEPSVSPRGGKHLKGQNSLLQGNSSIISVHHKLTKASSVAMNCFVLAEEGMPACLESSNIAAIELVSELPAQSSPLLFNTK